MGLTYEKRWEIRWARDRHARWRVWREDIIERELADLHAAERSRREDARHQRDYEWALSLPALLAEWQAREEAA